MGFFTKAMEFAGLGDIVEVVDMVRGSGGIVERSSNLVERTDETDDALEGSGRRRFTFLVDTSYSMGHGIAEAFSGIHGEFLDSLAERFPASTMTLVTFDDEVEVQYRDKPIRTAATLTMRLTGATDFPNAIVNGIDVRRLGSGDVVIIVTDGDVSQHHGSADISAAKSEIVSARRRGARFLFLFSGGGIERARSEARKAGITNPDDVRTWEHSATGIQTALDEVADDLLILGKH